jgi:hypothetical protein
MSWAGGNDLLPGQWAAPTMPSKTMQADRNSIIRQLHDAFPKQPNRD